MFALCYEPKFEVIAHALCHVNQRHRDKKPTVWTVYPNLPVYYATSTAPC